MTDLEVICLLGITLKKWRSFDWKKREQIRAELIQKYFKG